MTTPEGAKGWDSGQARHDVPGGGHGRATRRPGRAEQRPNCRIFFIGDGDVLRSLVNRRVTIQPYVSRGGGVSGAARCVYCGGRCQRGLLACWKHRDLPALDPRYLMLFGGSVKAW